MNELSILLYVAGVVGKLGGLLGFLAVPFVLLSVASIIFYFYAKVMAVSDENSEKSQAEARLYVGPARNWGIFTTLVALSFMFLAVLTPSRDTVMLIAASQFTGSVLENPETQKLIEQGGDVVGNAINLLNQQIIEQLEKPEPKEE